jgi:hypothetical protein
MRIGFGLRIGRGLRIGFGLAMPIGRGRLTIGRTRAIDRSDFIFGPVNIVGPPPPVLPVPGLRLAFIIIMPPRSTASSPAAFIIIIIIMPPVVSSLLSDIIMLFIIMPLVVSSPLSDIDIVFPEAFPLLRAPKLSPIEMLPPVLVLVLLLVIPVLEAIAMPELLLLSADLRVDMMRMRPIKILSRLRNRGV